MPTETSAFHEDSSTLSDPAAIFVGIGTPNAYMQTLGWMPLTWPMRQALTATVRGIPTSAVVGSKFTLPESSAADLDVSENTQWYSWDGAPRPTGTITITEGDQLLDTIDVSQNDLAWLPAPGSLTLGEHDLTVTYSGDDNYLGSSTTTTVNVTLAPTTVTISPGTNEFFAGSPVPIGAMVTTSVPDLSAPTGTVTFSEGNQVLATARLGDTSPINLNLPVGMHTITVNYSGDEYRQPSSNSATVDVLTPTTTDMSLSYDSQSVHLTANVKTPEGGVPGGYVEFVDEDLSDATYLDDATILDPDVNAYRTAKVLGKVGIAADGSATLDLTAWPHGNFRAVYVGANQVFVVGVSDISNLNASGGSQPIVNDSTFASSVSSTVAPPGQFLSKMKLTALVPTFTNPILNVQLSTYANKWQGLWPVNGSDTALPNDPRITRGSINSVGSSLMIETGGMGSFSSPGIGPDLPTPTGFVRLYENNQLLTTVPFDQNGNLVWTAAVRSLSLGDHHIHAVYDGDANYFPATDDETITITHTPTQLELTPSKYEVQVGQKVSLQALVSEIYKDTVTPTGTIVFSDGKKILAKVKLGKKEKISLALSRGNHRITAKYVGDGNCLGSSNSVTISVVKKLPHRGRTK